MVSPWLLALLVATAIAMNDSGGEQSISLGAHEPDCPREISLLELGDGNQLKDASRGANRERARPSAVKQALKATDGANAESAHLTSALKKSSTKVTLAGCGNYKVLEPTLACCVP